MNNKNTNKINLRQWIAFIPLRMGSKRVIKKNIRPFLGKPLYSYTVEQAINAGAAQVIISTDIPEILEKKFDTQLVKVIKRPAYLSSDKVEMDQVICHCLNLLNLNKHLIVLLQATSPLRTVNNIKKALTIFNYNNYDLVLSATKTNSDVFKCGTIEEKKFTPLSRPNYCFQNTQNLPLVYRPNGAIYIFESNKFLRKNSFPTKKIGVLEMNINESIDIDNIDDFALCEHIYTKKTKK
jgi:CMP-N,N'-diacetyllegionaminic acid synthase